MAGLGQRHAKQAVLAEANGEVVEQLGWLRARPLVHVALGVRREDEAVVGGARERAVPLLEWRCGGGVEADVVVGLGGGEELVRAEVVVVGEQGDVARRLCVEEALVAELDEAGRGRTGRRVQLVTPGVECAIHTRVVAVANKKAKEKISRQIQGVYDKVAHFECEWNLMALRENGFRHII